MGSFLDGLSIKTRLFLGMMLAQIGFIIIGVAGGMGFGTTTIVVLTIIFVILASIVNYSIMGSVVGGIQRLEVYFGRLLDFITLKINRFEYSNVSNDSECGKIFKMIDTTAKEIDESLKSDMKVMGEIVLVADKVEQGIYGCRVHANSKNPMIMTLKNTMNSMLNVTDSNMNSLKKTLESYTHHDFRPQVTIDSKLKAEMLAVMQSVNTLGKALIANAKDNLSNGQVLEQNSSTMSSSVSHLAARANEQAASLEETAAALEEITSLTRNNAENAAKMATLGTTVKASVSKGEQLAGSTTRAMDEINTQITSINEAITVIDQISFQTNILSLNAAVEAATAGEAGKGFAVVAAEVRNLATRSAEAAKEIKALVESATSKANDGKKIADEMIKGYHDLNTHITHTINIISDVSTASREQMTGIEQINDAVTMLDRVTQENASEANNVSNIANEVLEMANALVSDAKSKRF